MYVYPHHAISTHYAIGLEGLFTRVYVWEFA